MPTELEREFGAAVTRHAIRELADAAHRVPSEAPLAREPGRELMRAARRVMRQLSMRARWTYYVRGLGMRIDASTWFSSKVHFDRTHPSGIHIGRESYIAFGAVILTHDMTRGLYADTRFGRRRFIGARSILEPGVTIGDGSIVEAGSIVTRDVPPASIVAGNPARVLRTEIKTYRFGCLWDWDARGMRHIRSGGLRGCKRRNRRAGE